MFNINGWRVEITGRASYGTRPKVESLLRQHGAISLNEVNSSTTILLIGRQSGNKKPKQIQAESLGIQIYDADTFIDCLQKGTVPTGLSKLKPAKPAKRASKKDMRTLVAASKKLMGEFAV